MTVDCLHAEEVLWLATLRTGMPVPLSTHCPWWAVTALQPTGTMAVPAEL